MNEKNVVDDEENASEKGLLKEDQAPIDLSNGEDHTKGAY